MNVRTLLHLSKRAALSSLVALSLIVASNTARAVEADANKRKGEVAVEAKDIDLGPRKTLGKDRKSGPLDLLVLEKKAESRKKLDAQIVRLKELLKITRKNDPRRAEVLFSLSEAYWEKSKAYGQEVYTKQDECYNLNEKGDKTAAQRCQQTMADMKSESDRLRQESVKLYVDIVQNYPDFKELDTVLYYLGANLQEIGRKDESLEMFKRLASDFPKSKYIPQVLLAFGDHYFDDGDMDNALRAYEKVRSYPGSPVFAYARYKEAWCYFNLDQKDKALATFLDVLKLAEKDDSSTAAGLVKQTRKDIVMTYSFIGAPDKAIPFFKKITSGDGWVDLAERLAVLYSDKGKPDASTAMYRALIQANKKSWKVVDYQYEVVRNTMIDNAYSPAVVGEIVQLLKLVQYADAGKFQEMDQEEYKKTRAKIEEFVRNDAALYHREAQKTKSDKLYGMAYILYQHYLETFPNGPEAYTMTFFYAELLYRVEKWKEAAAMYDKAIELEPKGKYTNEAVHGLVLSYFKLVQISEKTDDLANSANKMMNEAMDRANSDGKGKPQPPPPIPEPKPLPELEQKLIKACELYIQLNPDGKEIVPVYYTMARKYYDFYHLKEAIPLFHKIAYNYPKDPLAIVSANLELDAYNLLHDYDGLDSAVEGYLKDEPIKDPEFLEDLRSIGASIKFMKCTVYDEKEQWKQAAQCFVSFFRQYPDSEHIDKALYNAALDFERMKDLNLAIKVRSYLLKQRPDSPLAPKALYDIGANYHALAVYSQASPFYERYAQTYPNKPEAKIALANAATFREGLGDYDQAFADNENYLKRYGNDDAAKTADIFFQNAKILEMKKDKEGAFSQYKQYIKKYGKKGSADQLLQANLKLGLYYWHEEGWKNRLKALKIFKDVVKMYEKMSPKVKDSLTSGLDAVAQAKFMMAEDIYDKMAGMKLNSKNEKELKKQLKEKSDVAQDAKKLYEEVVEYKRPDWAIAALYRLGNAYENFANNIRQSPPPRRLTYDQKEIYRGILEDNASSIELKAVDAYKKALDVAKQASWFNDYSEKSEQALSQLRPQDYRTPSEKRARPVNMAMGIASSKYIKNIEDEDRLSDLDSGDAGEVSQTQAAPQGGNAGNAQ